MQIKPNRTHVIAQVVVPPYDELDFTTIGEWDERDKKFIPKSNDLMNRFIQAQWRSYKHLPLIVDIMKTAIDGEHPVYRSLSDKPSERTIIYITKEDMMIPTYEQLLEKEKAKKYKNL